MDYGMKCRPVMLRYGRKEVVHHILVKAPADKLVATNKFMEAKWKELFPNRDLQWPVYG
jgi:putative ABC transport system permease protein